MTAGRLLFSSVTATVMGLTHVSFTATKIQQFIIEYNNAINFVPTQSGKFGEREGQLMDHYTMVLNVCKKRRVLMEVRNISNGVGCPLAFI